MIKIREARFEDCEQILKFYTQLQEMHVAARPDIFEEGQAVMDENEFENLLSDSDRMIIVAENEGFIAGMIEIEFSEILNPILVKRKVAVISSIIVEKTMRKKGIGQMLFDEEKKTAINRNVKSLELNLNMFHVKQ